MEGSSIAWLGAGRGCMVTTWVLHTSKAYAWRPACTVARPKSPTTHPKHAAPLMHCAAAIVSTVCVGDWVEGVGTGGLEPATEVTFGMAGAAGAPVSDRRRGCRRLSWQGGEIDAYRRPTPPPSYSLMRGPPVDPTIIASSHAGREQQQPQDGPEHDRHAGGGGSRCSGARNRLACHL